MKKGHRFGLVLSGREKRALTRLAELEGGLSEAATVRRLIRKTAREQGVWFDGEAPITNTTTTPQAAQS